MERQSTILRNELSIPQPIEPSVECLDVLDIARESVRKKLDGKFLDNYSPLGQSHAYHMNRMAIIDALAKSDEEATKVACRIWYKLVVNFTLENRKGEGA